MIGEFGICIEDNSKQKEFLYMIAGTYNGSSLPEGMKIFNIDKVVIYCHNNDTFIM